MAMAAVSDWFSEPGARAPHPSLPPDHPHAFRFTDGAAPNTTAVEERGWLCLEHALATIVKPRDLLLELVHDDGSSAHGKDGSEEDDDDLFGGLDLQSALGDMQPAAVPLTPAAFNLLVSGRVFDEAAECSVAQERFRAAFTREMGRVEERTHAAAGWVDDEARRLSQVLELEAQPRLTRLSLARNRIGDAGMAAIAAAIASGAAPALKEIDLDRNAFGDGGATALASCGRGALLQLEKLSLSFNTIADAASSRWRRRFSTAVWRTSRSST